MEGSEDDGLAEEESGPLFRFQQRLNESNLPISLTNNTTLNLMAGGAIILYWGAIENLLDRYFLIKRVPNVAVNSLLRIALGLGILAFQDNDIKELGDKWEGLEEEEEEEGDDNENNPILQESNLATVVSESVFLASRGYDWCGDSTLISKDQIESIFGVSDRNKDIKLEASEISTFRKKFLRELQVQAAKTSKANEAEEEEDGDAAEVDRFHSIERFLEQNGMSLNLHHEYFQNFWLGTGIVTVWNGMGIFFDAVFGFRGMLGHTVINSFIRVIIAAGILYLPGGNLNDLGDGFLEDEEEESASELRRQELQMCIAGALQNNKDMSDLISAQSDASITLKTVLDAYDRLDGDKVGAISTRALILSLAKGTK